METLDNKTTDHIVGQSAEPRPLVAIRCITYNHEPYIRDALEGFVMQKTDFPFVAVVHDDASTDGTADIIREYAARYPHIIKPLYETENQYSKGDGSMSRMMNRAVVATGAKYIALCEGDDYWTDPLKLQKQVDFLESHPDYSMVFANVRFHYIDGLSDTTFPLTNRQYYPIEIYRRCLIATPTIVYRSDVLNSTIFKKFSKIRKPVFGDLTLYMACSSVGKIYGLQDVVGGYRRLPSGATNYLTLHPYRHFRNRLAISRHLGKDFTKIDFDKFKQYFSWSFFHLHKDFPDNLKFILRLFSLSPMGCIQQAAGALSNKIR